MGLTATQLAAGYCQGNVKAISQSGYGDFLGTDMLVLFCVISYLVPRRMVCLAAIFGDDDRKRTRFWLV
jgi:hypothetical protein